MRCSLCALKLRDLLAALLPLTNLGTLPLPPSIGQLNAYASTLASPPSTLAFNSKLALSLPPLPVSFHLVEQISATATAMETLHAGLGVSPLAPGGASTLALAITPLKFNLAALMPLLPRLPLLPSLTSLSLALSCVAMLRARLGIDLLAPKVALNVNAALGLPGANPAAPLSPLAAQAAARARAYAKLSAAAAIFGGPPKLLPSLRLAAQIRLPQIPGNMNLLALLAALNGLRANLAALGITHLSAAAIADLRVQLRPLTLLPPLALNLNSLASPGALPMLDANFMLSAQAIAALKLSAVANLQLPNLAPLSLLANVSAVGLSSPAACSSCPMSGPA